MAEALDERNIEAIERRIAAATAVRQAVQAFWALARAQLPRTEEAARQVEAYHRWTDDLARRVSGAFAPREAPPTLHVVFGPERPFCGGLPGLMSRALPQEGELGLVGHRLGDLVTRDPRVASRVRFVLPAATVIDDQRTVAIAVAKATFEACPTGDVELIYPRVTGRDVMRMRFLGAPRDQPDILPETFSPIEVVRAAALVESNAVLLSVAPLHTLLAEVRARVVSAEAAKSAADRRIDALSEARRTARRDLVTRELLEIVAGAEALRDPA